MATASPWLRIFAPYAAAYFFSYLLRNINAVIAPTLASEFSFRASDLGLMTAAYLVGFALMQLPVGLALDRYGPRRVATFLLLVAASGCLLFANAGSLLQLILARCLMGIGVSACLMAGFKAFSLAFPAVERASVNAAIMAAGGLGALTATQPLVVVLDFVSWQSIFVFIALFGAGLAWLLSRTDDGPSSNAIKSSSTLCEQLGELQGIFVTRTFWRFAPVTGLVVGGFIAIQGLWAAQWLAQVVKLDAMGVSQRLMLLTIGLIVGYTLIARVLLGQKIGRALNRILVIGTTLVITCQALIISELLIGSGIWLIYGVFSALMNVAYTSHAGHYSLSLQGRANTCLNLAIFVCGFLIQWGIGASINLGERLGWGTIVSFKAVWSLLIVLQLCGLVWFVVWMPQRPRILSEATMPT